MTAKEYLSKVHTYRRAIRSTQQRLDELYTMASGVKAITYDKDRVQVSPENRFEAFMAQIDEEASKMAAQIARYQREAAKRQRQIAELSKPEYSEVLELRYIETDKNGCQYTLEQSSHMMHLSFHRVAHLHGEALLEFDRKYKVSKH